MAHADGTTLLTRKRFEDTALNIKPARTKRDYEAALKTVEGLRNAKAGSAERVATLFACWLANLRGFASRSGIGHHFAPPIRTSVLQARATANDRSLRELATIRDRSTRLCARQ